MALGPDFLAAYSNIPKSQQKKVREFTEKFRNNPTSSGINYEKIKNSKDPNVRSVRIDQTYRAIVVKPPKGDVYMLAWVDHHDDAYKWAENRRFEVNPRLGHLQIYQTVEVVEEQLPPPRPEPVYSAPPTPKLLGDVDDDTLELFGAPKALFPALRKLETEAQLTDLIQVLPADVSDALYLLGGGLSPEAVLKEIGRAELKDKPPEPIDTEDFTAALEKPASQRVFALVDDQQLDQALTAPLEQWRLFLHPDQRALVEWDVNGPIRVLGGAGTGKTVALMHRAAHLAKKLKDDERMLVTTFTKNLSLELGSHLKTLCGDRFSQIDVTNLDSWASQYLRGMGIKMTPASSKAQREAWDLALAESELDFPRSFYEEEWTQVVQAQDVVDRRSYFKASRKGRGTRVSRQQRAELWEVFSRYREQLSKQGRCEYADTIREARIHLESKKADPPYRYVLADEVQDFSDSQLKLLRALAPEDKNDLFLVGDPHQRIYGIRSSMGRCGIAIVGRSRRLRVNYRTTAEISNWAVSLLQGLSFDDLDDGEDNLNGYHAIRNGRQPDVEHFDTDTKEADFVVSTIKNWLEEPGVAPSHICLTTGKNGDLENRYKPLLEGAGISTVELDRNTPESELPSGVRLGTMHRMKGLEFARVLMANYSDDGSYSGHFADLASKEDYQQRERSLKYVAATRARDVLAVCGYGD
jgi:UvrD-like helicase family protein